MHRVLAGVSFYACNRIRRSWLADGTVAGTKNDYEMVFPNHGRLIGRLCARGDLIYLHEHAKES